MARRNASELIMAVTAMNNELIMLHRNASELIMAISAMNNILFWIFSILFYVFYIILLNFTTSILFLLKIV